MRKYKLNSGIRNPCDQLGFDEPCTDDAVDFFAVEPPDQNAQNGDFDKGVNAKVKPAFFVRGFGGGLKQFRVSGFWLIILGLKNAVKSEMSRERVAVKIACGEIAVINKSETIRGAEGVSQLRQPSAGSAGSDINLVVRLNEEIRLQALGNFFQIHHDDFFLHQAGFVFTQTTHHFDFFRLGNLIQPAGGNNGLLEVDRDVRSADRRWGR